MTDTNDAGLASSDPLPFVHDAPKDTPQAMSPTDAARLLRGLRKPKEPEAAPTEAAAPAKESETAAPAVEDASPPPAVTDETTEAAPEPEAEALPAIEPPRSWKAEEKERFRSLPRETQEYLAERESDRDRALNRSQSEAAEKLKGLTAKEQAVEQARQQYESALPQLLQTLQTSQTGEFHDIRTIQDVERLAREDWPRYLQWDVAQKKIAAVQQEYQSAQQRQQQEKLQQFTAFAKKEDDLFIEKVPDMANADKASRLQKQALTLLKDLGFSDTELGQSWNGEKDLSLRDHRLQLLIRDATLYREAQARAKTITARPAPPVQRPGAATGRNAGAESELKSLAERLERTGNPKDAAAFLRARRAAAR